MQGAVAALLDGGRRLHLQHGPIDLIIGVDGPLRDEAFAVARSRFETILTELVAELPLLRQPLVKRTDVRGLVAARMVSAADPFIPYDVTPMIAVAGAVADEVLAAMTAALPLERVYVNNGGDIAVHLGPGQSYEIAMSDDHGGDLGRVRLIDRAFGVATSGARGRSLSLGIADSVTVVADAAACADAVATLIANAVALPEHQGITRVPACKLDPDSDLRDRLVVTGVPTLRDTEVRHALAAGQRVADAMMASGQIAGAALFLQGQSTAIGPHFHPKLEAANV